MLSTIARLSGAALVSVVFAHAAAAQETTTNATTNVTTSAASAKVGGEFRAELNYDDHGFEKVDGGDAPSASSTIELQRAALSFHGNINKDTEYAFLFNLLDVAVGRNSEGETVGLPAEYAYGTHWLSKSLGLSIGKMKVLQGGFDNIDGDFTGHSTGHYADNLAFDVYDEMIAVNLKMAGDITIQLLNDKVVGPTSDAEWNTNQHPTWVLGWRGDFGSVTPLVNIGSYDNNKSRWIDLGVATEMSGLTASVDVYMKSHSNKVADGDKSKSVTDEGTGLTLNVGYEIKGTATPFFYFSSWDNKQGSDDDSDMEDKKVNDYEMDATGNVTGLMFNDNGQTIAVGANFDMMGDNYTPYVAVVTDSGKFDEGGEEKTKSNMWLRIGVNGKI